jgi:ATP-dependent RNA helicase HrpA
MGMAGSVTVVPGSDTGLRLAYPEALPITAQRGMVLEAIRDHQVVVVAGETGSGKSTQLPKLCLELGRGVERTIGHTQPRRLAARTVAARIAEELGSELGDLVGYKVRFSDQVSERTRVKLMTDGILLAELRSDPLLERYDTILVDEAHERSLNIDFLLGYLTDLLPRRPDLKVVVTSATIDTERFARHFDAPVVEVSGRTFPVEVRYRPIGGPPPARGAAGDGAPQRRGDHGHAATDQVDAIGLAIDELRKEGPGDVLVFLSGQREIHDAARALADADLPDTEILPLYARLSAAEQQRAFRSHRGRRIVLATNVAETSITVPGVRYVVDTGTARISRYNRRTKLQRLPIEPVSKASADQRAGRCGRVAPGIAIRLYDEDDFDARPEFTEPEILRTNLASVILQMADLGLGDVERFPFIDPPDARAVRDAVALLTELGALAPDRGPGAPLELTRDGRRMARLPVDPRFGRMLLAAEEDGCLREVTVIVAGLSIQDPRERPTGEEQQADELHARFAVPGSDFLAYLRLWEHLTTEQRARTGNGFRRMCRAEHLNFVRVREWQDLVRQLREATHDLGMRPGGPSRGHRSRSRGRPEPDRAERGRERPPAEPDAIHRSLLAGLLSHVGMWDRVKGDYRGARQARFTIAPGSVMTRSSPSWLMAGELVETGRLRARVVARVDPSWIEPLADHLVKRSYGEPQWDRRRGAATIDEQVSLYGLPIVPRRPVALERIDAAEARAMFVDHALVEGDWDDDDRYPFAAANRRTLDEALGLEARARRADLAVDERRLAHLYGERLPANLTSAPRLARWWRGGRQDRGSGPTGDESRDDAGRSTRAGRDALTFSLDDVLGVAASTVDTDGFPLTWAQGDLVLDLSYVFEPGADDDGVTVHVPLVVLPQLSSAGVDWHVPGHREELVTALIRTLPKATRRQLSPAPERAREALDGVGPGDGPLLEVLAERLAKLAGTAVVPADFDLTRLPRHLQLRFSVEDAGGRVVATGRDLDALSSALAAEARRAVVAATPRRLERQGLGGWPTGGVPRTIEATVDGQRVRAYPTLVDEGETVGVRVVTDPATQQRLMAAATRRLVLLAAPAARSQVERRLSAEVGLAATGRPVGGIGLPGLAELATDCLAAAADRLIAARGGPVWDDEAHDRLAAAARERLAPLAVAAARQAGAVVAAASRLADRLAGAPPGMTASADDMRAHLARLVHPGFVQDTGLARLTDLARYVEAVGHRLDKLRERPDRDRDLMARARALEAAYDQVVARLPEARHHDDDVVDVHWLLEELRVGLFAQVLGTARPVSEQRARRALASLSP